MREKVFVVTDDNASWVLDEIVLMDLFDAILRSVSGKHHIRIDHDILGPTCGLLPVDVDSTLLTTIGLRWNLGEHLRPSSGIPSLTWSLGKMGRNRLSINGLVSTSNRLLPEEPFVTIKTSRPIW